jgi:hypothetical protein
VKKSFKLYDRKRNRLHNIKRKIEDKIKRLSNEKLKIAKIDTYKPNQVVKELNRMVEVVKAPIGFDSVKAVEIIYIVKL